MTKYPTYIARVTLSTSVCNVDVDNGHISRWYYSWKSNQIVAYTQFSYKGNIVEDIIDLVERSDGLNIGLLIDTLTFCVNVGTNASIMISASPKTILYSSISATEPNSIDEFKRLCRSNRPLVNASSIGPEWPKRINEAETTKFDDNGKELYMDLLNNFSHIPVFEDIDKKLLNYWRKGVDLDNLGYDDESFLCFYKILETFEKKSKLLTEDIPPEYRTTETKKKAYRIAIEGNLKSITSETIDSLSRLIRLRNNADIAHSKVKKIGSGVWGALYYSSFIESWGDYHDIREISRLFILRKVGLKGYGLKIDGGLFHLAITDWSS